jgi:hypothetical protein
MRKSIWMAILLAVTCSMGAAQAQVGQHLKNAGHDTADATKTAGHKTTHETEHIVHRTAHTTKRAAHKTATGTRNVGRRVEDKPPVPNNPH